MRVSHLRYHVALPSLARAEAVPAAAGVAHWQVPSFPDGFYESLWQMRQLDARSNRIGAITEDIRSALIDAPMRASGGGIANGHPAA
jgi:hypothetical protein